MLFSSLKKKSHLKLKWLYEHDGKYYLVKKNNFDHITFFYYMLMFQLAYVWTVFIYDDDLFINQVDIIS